MKKIEAIIKPFKLDEVKDARQRATFPLPGPGMERSHRNQIKQLLMWCRPTLITYGL